LVAHDGDEGGSFGWRRRRSVAWTTWTTVSTSRRSSGESFTASTTTLAVRIPFTTRSGEGRRGRHQ
jgi:hypothetical protein